MDFSEETVICRLCLKKFTDNCAPIEEIQHTLNFLTLYPNLTISEDPMMCESCAVNLTKCFDFKGRCLSTEDCIVSFAEGEDKKVDLRDMYSKVNLDGNTDEVPDDHSVCRLCLELVKSDASVSVRHDVDLIEILQKYFLELDLKITDDIIACTVCCNSLRLCVSFVNNVMNIEGRIDEYCTVEGLNCKGQVDLRDVATFISKSFLNAEDMNSLIIKEEKLECMVDDNVDVKVKFEDSMDVEQKEELVDKEVQQESSKSFQHHPSPSQSDGEQQLIRAKPAKYMCEMCGYQTDRGARLRDHILTHKSRVPVARYNCELCRFKTKRKAYLRKHLLRHKNKDTNVVHTNTNVRGVHTNTDVVQTNTDVVQANTDVVQANTDVVQANTDVVQANTDVVSRGTMHKCDLCIYQTKWKAILNRHMLVHKAPSEITMYKCQQCAYEARHKANLQRHVLIHMVVSETEMHKCHLCPFETELESALREHVLSHSCTRDTATRQATHKCDLCDYKTKRKFLLKRHMLIHQTRSDIMYKCQACGYETKYKNVLQQHMLVHMDSSKIEMHKCELCPFKTKWKDSLRYHLRTHRNTPDMVKHKVV